MITKIDSLILEAVEGFAMRVQRNVGLNCFALARLVLFLNLGLNAAGEEKPVLGKLLGPTLTTTYYLLILVMTFHAEWRCPPALGGIARINMYAADAFNAWIRILFLILGTAAIAVIVFSGEGVRAALVHLACSLDWLILYLIACRPGPREPSRLGKLLTRGFAHAKA